MRSIAIGSDFADVFAVEGMLVEKVTATFDQGPVRLVIEGVLERETERADSLSKKLHSYLLIEAPPPDQK